MKPRITRITRIEKSTGLTGFTGLRNEMRDGWRRVKLGECITVKHGWAFPGKGIKDNDNGKVLVTPGNFSIGGGFKESGKKFYDGEYPEEYILRPNDLVVTMTDLSKQSDTLGLSAKIPNVPGRVYLHNQRIGLVRTVSKFVDSEFVYWLLRSPRYHNDVVSTATGTTVRHTSPSRIANYSFSLPPLSVQQRIAAVLGALDDKIELNRKMNANLEAQAQALFKSWFIDFEPWGGQMPAGWKKGTLGEICRYCETVVSANTLTANNYVSTENMVANKGGLALATSVPPEGDVPAYHEGCVLVSNIRPYFKKIIRAENRGGRSHDVLCFEPVLNGVENYLYLHLRDDSFFDYMMAGAKGTKMPRGDKKQIMRYRCVVADDATLQTFNATIGPMLSMVSSNINESRQLAALRDALLPKLMSGELSVEEVA